ncbi:MAG: coenzyme F420-reducing hydrogenase, FrhD protein [Methanosphaera sp. rholeuAM74]|nr:MAG: coenzyme F420-reducing hydrogenase, FrhD protein [Methanosphaera sp. rholeuAM74]
MSYNHENLIVGCGNILFGDDGVGPEVIRYMQECNTILPGDTVLIDGGTSSAHYIFTLPEDKWKNIIIIDCASMNMEAGSVCVLDLDDVAEGENYCEVHELSLISALSDLDSRINVRIVACQPEKGGCKMGLGLTKPVENAIPEIIDVTLRLLGQMTST